MKKILLSTLLASILATWTIGAKETAKKDATIKEVNRIAVSNATNEAKAQKKDLVQEAISSLKEAHEALLALEHNNKEKATKKLQSALGKLEVILASDKVPKLLPVDSVIKVKEYFGSSKDIDKALATIRTLLNQNKIQEARLLMMPLQSQIDITTVSLPLGSYPDALKLAAKYVHSGNTDKAKEVLQIALSTFASVTKIVPIPLLKATDLIVAAEDLAKEDKDRALSYLDGAADSLKVAHKLGYVSKSETTYKMLQEQIEEVKKEIKGPNKAEKLFEKLRASLKEFKEKIFSKSENNKQ